MPEIQLQQKIIKDNTEQLEIQLSSRSVVSQFEQQGIVVSNPEGVASSLDTLRSEFGIEDTVFDDTKTALMFTALADKLNSLEEAEDLSSNSRLAEMEYLADLVMLAAGRHTQYAELYDSTVENGHVVSTDGLKKAYEKFTQPELSKEMADYIHGAEFDELRDRLGVKGEDPYEVRVLSIGSGSESFGLLPDLPYREDMSQEEWKLRFDESEYRRAYMKGLEKNGSDFQQAMGRDSGIAPAWVATFEDGQRYLCIPAPTAEKVLYPNEERAGYYNEEERLRDLATIKHEYTHTQKMLLFDENVGLGIALEELRAEHFSGDKQGYLDVKRFFMGMHVLTGYTPKSGFEADGMPYDEERLMIEIAANVGLEGFVDVMTAIPSNYAADEKSNPYLKAMVAYNGGSLSAHFDRMYKRLLGEVGRDEIEKRVSEKVDHLRDIFKDNEYMSVENFVHYGGLRSFGRILTENFRRRYPDESDGYDYENNRRLDDVAK